MGRRCGCTPAAARRRPGTATRGWPGCGCARETAGTRTRAAAPSTRARLGPERPSSGRSQPRISWSVHRIRNDPVANVDPSTPGTGDRESMSSTREVDLSDEQWRERLSPEQYEILRKHGTE